MTAKLSPGITEGILRVISFILVCIGGEIMWNGIQALSQDCFVTAHVDTARRPT